MTLRAAAVVGATGLVGGYVVRRLLDDGRWRLVRTVGRRPLDIRHPRLEQAVGEVLEDGPWTAALAVDDVFCCLGTTIGKAGSQEAFRAVDHGAVVRVAQAARRRDATCFLLVSSLGADPDSRVFYSRVKGEVERDVAALGFSSCVVLRPSLLLGPRAERRPGERLAAWLLRPLGPLLGPFRPIPADAVAAAMVRLAAAPPAGFSVWASRRLFALPRGAAPAAC